MSSLAHIRGLAKNEGFGVRMRTKRALRSLVASFVLQVITAISGFLLPSLFIVHYGSVINGLVGSTKQFLGYLTLVEAGVGAASIAALYSPLADRAVFTINAILAATKIFYRRSGYLFVSLLVVMGIVYPFLMRDQVDVIVSFCMVMLIGIGGVAEYFILGKYLVLLTADQKSYVLFAVQAVVTGVSTTISVLLVVQNAGILLVQAVATSVYLLRVVIIHLIVRRLYPEIAFDAPPDFVAIKDRWSAFGHQVAGLVVFNSPVVVISVFLGLKDVSVYLVYGMVFGAVGSFVAVFSSGLIAGLGELIAIDDNASLEATFGNFEYVYFAVLTWAYVCAGLLVMPFMRIYTRGFSDVDYVRPDIAWLLLLVGVANNVRVPSNALVIAAGHFRQTRSRAFVEAGINIAASLVLVQFLGIVGVLLGSVLSFGYRTIDFIHYANKRLLSASSWRTVRGLSLNGLFSMMAAAPFVFWIAVTPENYVEWFVWAIAVSIVVLLVVGLGNIVSDRAMFAMSLKRLGLPRWRPAPPSAPRGHSSRGSKPPPNPPSSTGAPPNQNPHG